MFFQVASTMSHTQIKGNYTITGLEWILLSRKTTHKQILKLSRKSMAHHHSSWWRCSFLTNWCCAIFSPTENWAIYCIWGSTTQFFIFFVIMISFSQVLTIQHHTFFTPWPPTSPYTLFSPLLTPPAHTEHWIASCTLDLVLINSFIIHSLIPVICTTVYILCL